MALKKKFIPEHHSSIDAPVAVWEKINATGDVTWLLIKRKKVGSEILSELKKAWENIYDEYLQEFGLSDSFVEIKSREIEIAKLQLQLILTGDRTIETFIEVYQHELDDVKKQSMNGSFMDCKIAIETAMKFQINMHTTSIREFYSYLKHLN